MAGCYRGWGDSMPNQRMPGLPGLCLRAPSLCMSSFQPVSASPASFSVSSPTIGHPNWCMSALQPSCAVKRSPWGYPLQRRRGGSMSPSQWWRMASELAPREKLSDHENKWASHLLVLPMTCDSGEQRRKYQRSEQEHLNWGHLLSLPSFFWIEHYVWLILKIQIPMKYS